MTIYAYTDGASRGNPGESGIGIILRDEQGNVIFSAGGYIGTATNNIAEYQALLACLKKALTLRCKRLIVHSDSQLMVRQLQGTYRVKDKALQKYYQQAHRLLSSASFTFEIIHVEREHNHDADLLANSGIDSRQSLQV
ncbi:MAG: ribonuclease HI family protein [Ignavibacteria bacterium]|nr:ribonuclease HI family protein [Ignavibacteria bacterium]